ncbi:MAG: glutamate racemase [Eubacteriales bacterium]|jgi:glutamate racemase|nr:glutamate racemase [Eubacteriales bacterium]
MRIGFFDSGIGGITVLREALRLMPREDYLYYADTANLPYGTKTKDEVRRCVIDAADFIASIGVRALVVACNTATSVAVGDMRTRFDFPVIGMEPAVKPAVEHNGGSNKRILVTATPLTLKEEKLHNLIARLNGEDIVDLLPLPGLVTLAENFSFDRDAVYPYLRERLSACNLGDYDAVVLGCTHFVFYKEIFRELVPHAGIYDGNAGTVKNLMRLLDSGDRGTGDVVFYNSGIKTADAETIGKYRRLLDMP